MKPVKKVRRNYKTKDGMRVPGVTTVIGGSLGWSKDALIAWANREGLAGRSSSATRDKAAEAGTLGHDLIEAHILGQPVDEALHLANVDADQRLRASRAFEAYLEWSEAHVVVPYRTEVELVSEVHRVGGTIDLIARVDGVMCLVDHKTGKGVYAEHLIQLAAYCALWRECRDEVIERVIILHVSAETAEFKAHVIEQPILDAGLAAFIHLRALHDLKTTVALRSAA